MFGINFGEPVDAANRMRSGQPVLDMKQFWFSGGKSPFDELCQPFCDVAEAAGAGTLGGPIWNQSVDGRMAQLLLCDQLPRHLFRCSQRAFVYDQQAQEQTRVLCANLLKNDAEIADPLSGEFYPPYLVFILAALTHSEHIEDHALLDPVMDHAEKHGPPILLDWFPLVRGGCESHTRVVQRFGRYPHRNVAMKRQNTPEEDAWLADIENLPSWAKSQMV